MKVIVNAVGIPVRRIAGLVLSETPQTVDVNEEQLNVLKADSFSRVENVVAENAPQEDPVVFGRKSSEWKAEDLEELAKLSKGKGNTKEGKLAKKIIARLEEEVQQAESENSEEED